MVQSIKHLHVIVDIVIIIFLVSITLKSLNTKLNGLKVITRIIKIGANLIGRIM
jgi:hypothetical protein